MLKKLYIVSLLALLSQPLTLFAAESQDLSLHIQFNSNSNAYGEPIHIDKVVKISPTKKSNTIVMTQSNIVNNFPVTTAMLVKVLDKNKEQMTLQFSLVNYGFHQNANIYTQPRLVLPNHQEGEIKNDAFSLKVSVD
jgi:hypothetical protein